jgi:hypothetical protein
MKGGEKMRQKFLKPAILAIVLFVAVLLVAPVSAYANGVTLESIEVEPKDSTIYALGQTQQFTATGTYSDDTTANITDSVTWSSTNTSVVTIDANGLATGVSEGWGVAIIATKSGVSGGAGLSVQRGDLWADIQNPGEESYFNIWAENCSGLSWSLVINKNSTNIYSASGTIPSDEWSHGVSYTLLPEEGDYTATLFIGGTVQEVLSFTLWAHEASMDIDVGYAEETTKFTLNATNSSGVEAYFVLWRHVIEGDYYELDYEESINIDSDDWSYSISRTLPEGDYGADFWNGKYREDEYYFSVVARGKPKPEPVEKEEPKKEKSKPTPIDELPITRYEKTASGFLNLLYNRILQRNAEEEGLNAWLAWIQSGAATGSDLVQKFVLSEECQARISDYTNEQFITFLYKALLGRLPEADGLSAWLSRMSSGITREELIRQFALSEEFVNICKEFGIVPYEGCVNGQ